MSEQTPRQIEASRRAAEFKQHVKDEIGVDVGTIHVFNGELVREDEAPARIVDSFIEDFLARPYPDGTFVRTPTPALADRDYSALEERVLAHYPNIIAEEPYKLPVYTEKEPPMKSIALAGVAATAAMAASQGVSLNPIEKPEIPDRLSINPSSPHFWPQYKSLGVRIDGEERKGDVHEFCVSEGWAMVRARNEKGQYRINPDKRSEYLLERINGVIGPYFKRLPGDDKVPTQGDYDRIKAAEAKRHAKALKRSKADGV